MADQDQAAPGLLASTLLAAAEAHMKTRPSSASSGLNILDDLALQGGFRYGEVTSIAGTSGSGKTLVGFSFHPFLSVGREEIRSGSSFEITHVWSTDLKPQMTKDDLQSSHNHGR